ncbi:hypothetical protein [Actinomadura rubrisoli]|uniref:Uncharacterized protein n=1 Tax=Actinomadura rubrisoli TaxID=2530368 RepID=A0A4R5CGH4_9ACTN|nr:hypothetical protein [Actinomadura rubrisoli]TDD97570.1 hypothetical protein E1298_00640 [Actinomadura rubrisoli]
MSAADALTAGVHINETHLAFYAPDTATYWHTHRIRCEASGLLTVLSADAFGDTVLLGPMSTADADAMRAHLHEKGAPRTAVTVCDYAKGAGR